MNYLLSGKIINADGALTTNSLLVQAYQISLGSQTLIGESWTIARNVGSGFKTYEIVFEAAEEVAVNIQLRAYLPDGSFIGQTTILTNIDTPLNQDLLISEGVIYEQFLQFKSTDYGGLITTLQEHLHSVNLAIADLKEQDIILLEQELADQGTLYKVANLTRLVQSEQLANSYDLPGAFFYGIAKLQEGIAMELEAFLAFEDAAIVDMLGAGVGEGIIPVIAVEEILQKLSDFRKEKHPIKYGILSGKLTTQSGDAPLVGLRVAIFGTTEAEEGADFTDTDGQFLINYQEEGETVPEFSLSIFRGEESVYSLEWFDRDNPIIRFDLPPMPDTSPKVESLEVINGVGDSTIQTLKEQGIHSLRDLRRNREDLGDISSNIREHLISAAELNLLGNLSPEKSQTIIDAGFTNIQSLTEASKATVVDSLGAQIGTEAALHVWDNAKKADAIMGGIAADIAQQPTYGGSNGSGGNDNVPDEFQDLLDLHPESCGCSSCENAISRTAYLTDLMGYAVQKISISNQPLTFADLTTNFYQPFAELPADCHANHNKIRQIRICIEVLWAYINDKNLVIPEAAYKTWLWDTYEHFLEELGTSYTELRDVRVQDSPDDTSLQQLLDLLGLNYSTSDALATFNQLYITAANINEDWLETAFGWRNTQASPLADSATNSILKQSQKSRMLAFWATQDRDLEKGLKEYPIIDPDLIQLDYLQDTLSGRAAELWHERELALQEEYDRLKILKETAVDEAAAFTAVLPVGIEELEEPTGTPFLPQKAFAFILGVHKLISEGSPITNEEWIDIFNILVQYHKEENLYATWREEEATNDVFLTPEFFKIPPLDFSFPIKDATPLPEWRANQRQLREWERILKGRIERAQKLDSDWNTRIAKIEEAHLPDLRNLLINASDAPGSSLLEKASWLTEHLLIDTQMDACQITTRMQQAIEALQLLLWSLRTGQLTDTHPNWQLEDDDFDGKWKWLGTYARWRAAMLVYLFPENVLQPSLRRWQTPIFKELVKETRKNGRFSPMGACEAGQEMASYYTDISNLTPGAMVKAASPIYEGDCINRKFIGERNFIYQFAQSGKSGKVYWTRYIEEDASDYAMKSWEAVPGLDDVKDIVGASIFFVESEKYIYLFTKNYKDLEFNLSYIRFDLVNNNWEKSPTSLDIPEDHVKLFEAKVNQGLKTNEPPHLVVQLIGVGSIYSCKMHQNGEDWATDGFELIVNKAKGRDYILQDVIGVTSGAYYLFAIGFAPTFGLYYRIFDNNSNVRTFDDGLWREFGGINWIGGFQKPETDEVYGFVSDSLVNYNDISYAIVKPSTFKGARDLTNPNKFNEWFNDITGMSLTQIREISFRTYSFNLLEFLILNFSNAPEGLTEPIIGLFGRNQAEEKFNNLRISILNKIFESLRLANVNEEHGEQWEFASKKIKAISGKDLGGLLKGIYSEGNKTNSYERGSVTSELIVRKPWQSKLSKILALPKKIDTAVFVLETFYKKGACYRSFYHLIESRPLKEAAAFLATPPGVSNFLIQNKYTSEELAKRKEAIAILFSRLKSAPKGLKIYAEELLYFFPMHIGLQLQKRGHYAEALDWFSMVYHFSAPPSERKVYHGLVEEENFKDGLSRKNNWLLDPLNPHSIAETRANTYTRFTILRIIRCQLDYANAEFSTDSLESIPRARTLYQTALKLLKQPEVILQGNFCDLLLDEVDKSVVSKIPSKYKNTWNGLLSDMKKLSVGVSLENTKNAIEQEIVTATDIQVGLVNSRILLNGELTNSAPIPTIEERLDNRSGLLQEGKAKLLGIPVVEEAINKVVLPEVVIFSPQGALPSVPNNGSVTSSAVEVNLPSFGFCIPDNPVILGWQLEANLNLYKLQTCRNIEGLERPLEVVEEPLTIDSLPSIGAGGQISIPDTRTPKPTIYRYRILVERAKQLASTAQQMEASFLSSLEKRDAELYQLLKAGQDIELTREGVRLNNLKIREAEQGIVLTELQKGRAEIQEGHYQNLLNEGISDLELLSLTFLTASLFVPDSIGMSYGTAWGGSMSVSPSGKLQTISSITTVLANYERRNQEWRFAQNLAEQDVRISSQQIRLAKDRLRIVNQEHQISEIQSDHAKETLNFLVNKFTNADLYDWMSDILEGVYSSFLQQATAIAKLAQQQLAFERQEKNLSFIQSDYWESLLGLEEGFNQEGNRPDRRGLTGSARLLQDIAQLDQFAFSSDKRKQELTKVLPLSQLMPTEFQKFRKSGTLIFDTPMKWFNQDFPGHYMRQVKRIRVSVIALAPPTEGIKATLSHNGISRIISGEPFFNGEPPIKTTPETISLSTPLNATGQFDFELQQQNEMLRPFEGVGVDTSWTFELPKASNLSLDYNAIADVLITIDYTALYSDLYKQQVIEQLDKTFMADRVYSFRNDFPDQWYDLHHPELVEEANQLTVHFDLLRADFPPNVMDLKVKHITLYLPQDDYPNLAISLNRKGNSYPYQNKMTPKGIASSRQTDNFPGRWDNMLGLSPEGQWTLSFPNNETVRQWFKADRFKDILIVITYEGDFA